MSEDPERLLLISTTLHRKFPNSVVQTCRDSEAALEVARAQRLDAIVAHRSTDLDEIPLVEHLRAVTSAPIILMSGPHHAQAALAAGAAGHLDQEQWLLIGTTVAELIAARPAGE